MLVCSYMKSDVTQTVLGSQEKLWFPHYSLLPLSTNYLTPGNLCDFYFVIFTCPGLLPCNSEDFSMMFSLLISPVKQDTVITGIELIFPEAAELADR